MREPINTFVRCAFVPRLELAGGCVQATVPSGRREPPPPAPPPDPLVFDTWVLGPCSPNGQAQGQCPPGELFRVRLVPVAEGLDESAPRRVLAGRRCRSIAELRGPRARRARRQARAGAARGLARAASRPRACRPSPCIRSSP